jgi:hypothetical protein
LKGFPNRPYSSYLSGTTHSFDDFIVYRAISGLSTGQSTTYPPSRGFPSSNAPTMGPYQISFTDKARRPEAGSCTTCKDSTTCLSAQQISIVDESKEYECAETMKVVYSSFSRMIVKEGNCCHKLVVLYKYLQASKIQIIYHAVLEYWQW